MGQPSDGTLPYALLGCYAMKKFAVVAVASLFVLAGCNQKTPAQQNVIDTADNAAATLDNTAENLDAKSDNATNTMVAKTLENAADNAHEAADNVHEMGKEAAKNMKK